MLVFRLVDSRGNALTTGPHETLAPGHASAHGIFASNVMVACEIDLISGAKAAVRAAATVAGKIPSRRTTAAIDIC